MVCFLSFSFPFSTILTKQWTRKGKHYQTFCLDFIGYTTKQRWNLQLSFFLMFFLSNHIFVSWYFIDNKIQNPWSWSFSVCSSSSFYILCVFLNKKKTYKTKGVLHFFRPCPILFQEMSFCNVVYMLVWSIMVGYNGQERKMQPYINIWSSNITVHGKN